jgi:putative nucleotidyltransferase with HDIG domain
VTRYSEAIAHALGLAAGDVALVRTAAALHDLGKVLIPREILLKPSALTDAERALVERHPADGAAMLEGVADPEVVAMIRSHHERLDGSGYPDGLGGDELPIGVRIIAVADSYDAMTSERPYRDTRSSADALAELRAQAGVLFDPGVVLGLHQVTHGIDVPAPRDRGETVVERPAVRPLLA